MPSGRRIVISFPGGWNKKLSPHQPYTPPEFGSSHFTGAKTPPSSVKLMIWRSLFACQPGAVGRISEVEQTIVRVFTGQPNGKVNDIGNTQIDGFGFRVNSVDHP